jgi:hypothetical protein
MFDWSFDRTNMYERQNAGIRAFCRKNGANRAISRKPSPRASGVKLARP